MLLISLFKYSCTLEYVMVVSFVFFYIVVEPVARPSYHLPGGLYITCLEAFISPAWRPSYHLSGGLHITYLEAFISPAWRPKGCGNREIITDMIASMLDGYKIIQNILQNVNIRLHDVHITHYLCGEYKSLC